MEERDIFVRKVYTVEGISVCVEVDYARRTISLVERLGDGSFRNKDWTFADRELGYMNGWLRILKAMNVAIKEASKLLEAEQNRNTEDFAQLLMALDKNIKLPKDKKK